MADLARADGIDFRELRPDLLTLFAVWSSEIVNFSVACSFSPFWAGLCIFCERRFMMSGCCMAVFAVSLKIRVLASWERSVACIFKDSEG